MRLVRRWLVELLRQAVAMSALVVAVDGTGAACGWLLAGALAVGLPAAGRRGRVTSSAGVRGGATAATSSVLPATDSWCNAWLAGSMAVEAGSDSPVAPRAAEPRYS